MDWFGDTLQATMLAAPYLLAAGGAFVWIAAAFVAPAMLMWVVLVTLALFPASSLLTAAGGLGFDIYAKGAGYLFFSLYELAFMLTAAAAWLRVWASSAQFFDTDGNTARHASWANPLSKYYWAMLGIVLWHVIANYFAGELPLIAHFGRAGVVYLLMQGLFIAALVAVVDNQQKLWRLAQVVMFMVALRMLWGAFRFVFLGGDHITYEAADVGKPIRLTFFDINDSIWAMLVACGLLWLALVSEVLTRRRRALLLGSVFFLVCVVALSARRTAQIGAFLALLTMLLMLPKGRRWPVVAMLAVSAPVVLFQLQARMGDEYSLLQKLTDSRGGQYLVDPRYGRFYELSTAWRTMIQHPIVGVGPAGSFAVTSDIGLEYHKGNYGYVHSGFGHVMLKTGALGLLVFCGLLVAYLRIWWRCWRRGCAEYRPLLVASIGGFATSLPNLVVGTPLIELRTMLLLGVILVIPVLLLRFQCQAPRSQAFFQRLDRGGKELASS